MPDDRSVAPAREPITQSSTPTAQASPVTSDSRSVADARAPLSNTRMIAGRGIVDYVADNSPAPNLSWAMQPLGSVTFQDAMGLTNAAIDTTNESDSPTTLYGTGNPFAILGD